MPKNYERIAPVDPENPFCNPTEEPGYSPDYRDLAPALRMPGSALELFPSHEEKRGIRRNFAVVCLMLLFAFITALTIFTAGAMLVSVLLRQVDLRAVGTLPNNYPSIARQYFNDSSLRWALWLIAFTTGNLTAFVVGCKMTKIHLGRMFRLRDFGAMRLPVYILTGLWMQTLAGLLSEWLVPVLRGLGLYVPVTSITAGGSLMRTGVLLLYFCFLAPVTEELLFRGFVQKNASRLSQRFGIFIAAFLFALSRGSLPEFLLALPLGILLGYMAARHNSLWPGIAVRICIAGVTWGMKYLPLYVPLSWCGKIRMVYTLAVLLLGTMAFCYLCVAERLPEQTPHQSIRIRRLVLTTPLFWTLVLVHAAAAVFLPRFI